MAGGFRGEMAARRWPENLGKWLPDHTEGLLDIPVLAGVRELPTVERWVPFNTLSRSIDERVGIHMYVDDYRMLRLWNAPDRYIDLLGRAAAVMTPDYSMYTDMPAALCMYSHYRKHWLGAYWQAHGATVIPTICWAGEASFSWCFDGEPEGTIISVSSVGTQRYGDSRAAFLRGYDAMMERLQPSAILFYGQIPAGCRGDILPMAVFTEGLEKRRK